MIIIKSPLLEQYTWLYHGFLTNSGGYSKGNFSSLNLSYSVGDDSNSVDKNWLVVKNNLPFKEIQLIKQIHSDIIIETNEFKGDSSLLSEEGDGLITSTIGLGIGILTADCVPVLIVDVKERKVAAVHSGWRGAVKSITTKTIEKMNSKVKNIKVILGPSICGKCYEVGEDVISRVNQLGYNKDLIYIKNNSKYLLDMQKLVKVELLEYGISENDIFVVNCCTKCNAMLYSYRKSGKTGRQLSVIGVK